MARPQGTSPRAQRLIALFAVCAIAVATAFAFGRVFIGHGSTWRLMAVALASALVASALERRNLLLATLVSAAALAVVVGLLVFPGTTWHGLPTLDTLRHALDASHLVGEQARLQVAPSPPLKPLMLASILAMWAAIFSCHALAFRAGSPILALLPPIAMLAFADTVLEEFIKPVYGVVFLAASLAIVFADALRRVQGWGPVWTGPGSRARLSATASRGARRVAVAAVGTAMIVPFIVPGFGSKAIFDISSTNASDRVRIDPLVSIKASLTRNDPVEVFQVQADSASYWRMLSLTNFDGDTWRPDLTDTGDPLTPDMILSSGTVGTDAVQQTFTISSDLAFPWLPLAYPPQQIDVPDTSVRYNSSTGTATIDGELNAGEEYHVTSVPAQPTPAQLAAVTIPPAAQNVTSTSLEGVPPDVVDGIRAIADRWTAGAANDYERILAIQDHLSDPLAVHLRQDRPGSRRLLHDPRVPDDHEAGVLPTVRERYGRDAPDAGVPVAGGDRLHPGPTRSGHRRVPRHDERAPQLGRGAVPDVRLARLRAHTRPDEPRRERVSAPRRLLPPRDPGMPRRSRWRNHAGAWDDRRSERASSPAAEPVPAGALERARADAASPRQHGRSKQARAGGEGDPAPVGVRHRGGAGDPAHPSAAAPGSAAQSRARTARPDPGDV